MNKAPAQIDELTPSKYYIQTVKQGSNSREHGCSYPAGRLFNFIYNHLQMGPVLGPQGLFGVVKYAVYLLLLLGRERTAVFGHRFASVLEHILKPNTLSDNLTRVAVLLDRILCLGH